MKKLIYILIIPVIIAAAYWYGRMYERSYQTNEYKKTVIKRIEKFDVCLYPSDGCRIYWELLKEE